jgi:hypothetical protein
MVKEEGKKMKSRRQLLRTAGRHTLASMKSQSRNMAKTNEIAVALDWVPISVTAVCLLFDKRDPKLLEQEPCKGAETDSRAKFGKETIAEVYRRPK